MRAKRGEVWRPHMGFHEAEQFFRDKPLASFDFVPGEANAAHRGELSCFRSAADLQMEVTDAVKAGGDADRAMCDTINKDRACDRWIQYKPGLDPRQHFFEKSTVDLEEDRRQFQLVLNEWDQKQADRQRQHDRRISKAAIYFALIIGVAQIVAAVFAMTPESIGYGWGQ